LQLICLERVPWPAHCAKKRCLNVGEEVLARVVVNFRKSSDVIG